MTDTLNRSESMTPEPALVRPPLRVSVTLEGVLYTALLLLALVLRLAKLGAAPLSNPEAHEALAAWHMVFPQTAGSPPLAGSPLMFLLNSASFAVLGGTEFAARLVTALAGGGLVLLPLLWRRDLGRVGSLSAALLLAVSPVALLTARTMAPVTWVMLLTVLALWAAREFVAWQKPGLGLAAGIVGVAVLLLAGPTGWVQGVILVFAWWLSVMQSEDIPPDTHPAARLRSALAVWPWKAGLGYGLALALLVSTGFFLAPAGLSNLGELLRRGLVGLVARPEGYPFAFPLLASLIYEPALWLLGVIGVWQGMREGDFGGRFLNSWLLDAIVMALVYAGAGPDAALWLTLPLVALSGRVLARMVRPIEDAYWVVPGWAVPALIGGVLALLFVASTNFIWVVRGLSSATSSFQALHLLLGVMALLLLVILFFLGGSLWGGRAASRGMTLGVALFLVLYGLGSGWYAAVDRLDDPRELWHVAPVDRVLSQLRVSLADLSLRETGSPREIEVLVQGPNDDAVAWMLRDYTTVQYVPLIDRRAAAPVIVAPDSFQPEVLGARYVGQPLPLTRHWDLRNLTPADIPAWVMFRVGSTWPVVTEQVVIWARADVYGLPPAQVPDEAATSEEITP